MRVWISDEFEAWAGFKIGRCPHRWVYLESYNDWMARLGLSQIPLICSQELAVNDSMPRCVRVMLHAYSDRPRDEVRHVYLHDARQLRTDLPE